MKSKSDHGIGGTIVWLGFSLAMGFVVWAAISNQNGIYKTYLVQSGSMEPSIMVGDVIVIKKSDSYQINDVVTFSENGERRVTHRIIDTGKNSNTKTYSTKGDANRSGDRETVLENQILGKVIVTIPKLGYLVNFLKTNLGFGMLIILPATLIIGSELISLSKRGGS